MFINVLVSMIGAVFIVGSCMLMETLIDEAAETQDVFLSTSKSFVACMLVAVDGAIVIGVLGTFNIINGYCLWLTWFVAFTGLALILLYICWLSYFVKEGDIKEPLMAVAMVFAGLCLIFILTIIGFYLYAVLAPNGVLRLAFEQLNAGV